MKNWEDFEEKEREYFHDVVYDSFWQKEKSIEKMDDNFFKYFYVELPSNIKYIASNWGMSDTVFRDEAYSYILENLT